MPSPKRVGLGDTPYSVANWAPPTFGENSGHKCQQGTAQPGSPKKEWAAGGAKGTPWSVGANTWARPQYSSSAYQKDQPRPVTNSARYVCCSPPTHTLDNYLCSMFDESPNGTSLPMTYAPGPNTKRQFSKVHAFLQPQQPISRCRSAARIRGILREGAALRSCQPSQEQH